MAQSERVQSDAWLQRLESAHGNFNSSALRPQSLAVLKLLYDKAGELVTKNEIMSAVWAGVAVTDDSLVQCIADIRRSLADNEHLIVRTVSKRGYVLHLSRQPEAVENQFAEKPAIAVLPFKSLGTSAKCAMLAEALTLDVATDLSHSKEILVIAPASTAQYTSGDADPRQIGIQLNVGYVLSGAVLINGARMRVTTVLTDAATGAQVWAERYEETADDIFALGAVITQRIATTLTRYGGVISGSVVQLAMRKAPIDLRTYDFYRLGVEQTMMFNREANAKAKALLEKAIALDPTFARAYVCLGWAYRFSSVFDSSADSQRSFERWIEVARKAISLDPSDGEAHMCLAVAYACSNRFPEALPEVVRAEQLAPANADILVMAGSIWPWLGFPERGAKNADLALRLNPGYPNWYPRSLLGAYFYNREFEKAAFFGQQQAYAEPYGLSLLAGSLAELDRINEAKTVVEQILLQEPDWTPEKYVSIFGGFVREQEAQTWINSFRKAGGPVRSSTNSLTNSTNQVLNPFAM